MSMDNPKYKCPKCGSEDGILAASKEVSSYDDLIGATCKACGAPFDDESFKDQIRSAALKIAKDAFRKR